MTIALIATIVIELFVDLALVARAIAANGNAIPFDELGRLILMGSPDTSFWDRF